MPPSPKKKLTCSVLHVMCWFCAQDYKVWQRATDLLVLMRLFHNDLLSVYLVNNT